MRKILASLAIFAVLASAETREDKYDKYQTEHACSVMFEQYAPAEMIQLQGYSDDDTSIYVKNIRDERYSFYFKTYNGKDYFYCIAKKIARKMYVFEIGLSEGDIEHFKGKDVLKIKRLSWFRK